MWAGVLMRASALNSVAFLFTEVPRETLCVKSSRWRTLYSNRGSLSSLGLSLVLALIHKGRGSGIPRTSALSGSQKLNFRFHDFCELRLNGVLRSSRQLLTDGILSAGGKRPPASNLRAGE